MNILKEFLENSTIHGLAYIGNVPSKTGKVLWLAIVIAGFCTAGYLIKSSYSDWETSPVATSISTHPISSLPLPIITICPPENSNTALNVDLVRAGNVSLTSADRHALVNISRKMFIDEPSKNFLEKIARMLTDKDAIPLLEEQSRSYPTPDLNTDGGNNKGFEIWSTELKGSFKTPGFGSRRNYSTDHSNIHFTLYIPQKFVLEGKELANKTFDISIEAVNDEDYTIEYREGARYNFHGQNKVSWSEAETRCNKQNSHLVSIPTNYDFNMFNKYQNKENKKRQNVWIGGNDARVEHLAVV